MLDGLWDKKGHDCSALADLVEQVELPGEKFRQSVGPFIASGGGGRHKKEPRPIALAGVRRCYLAFLKADRSSVGTLTLAAAFSRSFAASSANLA